MTTGGNLISRLKLWVCQRSLDPENFGKTCPCWVFFFFFIIFFPFSFLTLSGVLIGFWLMHIDVCTRTSTHFTRCLIWLALRWHPAASNEARCRGRRTWGQRGNYNSTGFHLVLSSTTPPVFEPWLKTFKTRQRKKKRGEREGGKKISQLSKLNVIVSQKGIGNWLRE